MSKQSLEMEIALLDLDNEVPEKKPVKQKKKVQKKKSYYVKKPRDQWKRGRHPRSPESRAKQSATMKKRWSGPERERLVAAVSHKTEEQRQRMSEVMKEKFKNPEYYKKQVEHLKSIRHRTFTDEEKKKISDRQKGGYWCNNGVVQHKFNKGTPMPEGFVRGRLPFSEEAKKSIREASQKYWSTHKIVIVTKETEE